MKFYRSSQGNYFKMYLLYKQVYPLLLSVGCWKSLSWKCSEQTFLRECRRRVPCRRNRPDTSLLLQRFTQMEHLKYNSKYLTNQIYIALQPLGSLATSKKSLDSYQFITQDLNKSIFFFAKQNHELTGYFISCNI